MRSEPDVTGHDVETLKAVIDDHNIPEKALVEVFDRDRSSISRYLSGDRTIPVRCLRNLFERTGDLRLPALITGAVAVNFAIIAQVQIGANQPPRLRVPPLGELLPRTLDSIRQAATGAERMAQIVSDNRVGDDDKLARRDFRRAANSARENLAICLAALDAYERNVGGAK